MTDGHDVFQRLMMKMPACRFSSLVARDIVSVQPLSDGLSALFSGTRKQARVGKHWRPSRPPVYKERTPNGDVIIYNEWVKGK